MDFLARIVGQRMNPGSGLILEPPEIYETLPRHELFASGEGKPKDWHALCPPFRWQGASYFCTAYAGTAIGSIFERMERGGTTLFSPLELFYRSGGSLMGNYVVSTANRMKESLVLEDHKPTPILDGWNQEIYERWKPKSVATKQQIDYGKRYRVGSFAVVKTDTESLRKALLESPLLVTVGIGKGYWLPVAPKPMYYGSYHAVVLTKIFPDGSKEIFDSLTCKQGFDGFHILAPDYDILAALSFIDVPDDWQDQQIDDDIGNFAKALAHYGKPRDFYREKEMASKLSKELEKHPAQSPYFGSSWTICINALVYGGYSIQDLLNHFTSMRRGNGPIFNLNKPRV